MMNRCIVDGSGRRDDGDAYVCVNDEKARHKLRSVRANVVNQLDSKISHQVVQVLWNTKLTRREEAAKRYRI